MNWWHYLLLVNFYLLIFFGFYALLLRKETFFQLNRIYLVAASLLSFIIPLIQSDWVKNLFITQRVQQTIYGGPAMVIYNFKPAPETGITLGEIVNAVYITVTLCLVIRLAWQLIVLKKSIEKPSPSAAYTFFKKISLGENVSQSKIIAEHEQVHAGQWHSVDVMIIETVMIINWFNPVVYLYRFAIKYIHEFIADRQVIQAGTDKADYALLLLSQTFDVPANNLVNSFYNSSLLKKRILMLQKNKSHRIALAKYGLSAPLFMLMMIFSSATVINSRAVAAINSKTSNALLTPAADVVTIITDHSEISVKNKQSVTMTQPIITQQSAVSNPSVGDDPILSIVEQQPQFPGGLEMLGKFLAANIKYPKADREAGRQGKVMLYFVVETDGTLSEMKAINGPSETMKKEALRVMLKSPKWIAGRENGKLVRVAFTLPVNYTLTTDQSGDKVYSQVEKQPQFPGGLDAFMKFLGNNIRYPAEDRKNGVSGRAMMTFIVEEDGTLSDIKVVHTPSEAMGAEAIRVLSRSPRWAPGEQNGKTVRVSYTVPIQFSLNQESKSGTDTINKKTAITHPIYILDGKELSPSLVTPLAAIPQEDIERMEILRDDMAVKQYGERGRAGVILVTTKKGSQQAKTLQLTTLGLTGSPLILVDGKRVDNAADVNMIEMNQMEVLKGDVASKIYGTKAKDGAVILYTKGYKKK